MLLSAAGGLLATNASVGEALCHYLKSRIHVKWPQKWPDSAFRFEPPRDNSWVVGYSEVIQKWAAGDG